MILSSANACFRLIIMEDDLTPAQPLSEPPQHSQTTTTSSIDNAWSGVVGRAVVAAGNAGASDVHLRAGEAPWVRRGAAFEAVDSLGEVSEAEMVSLFELYHQMIDSTQDLSVTISVGTERWRLTVFQDFKGHNAVLRHIPSTPPALRDLGVPDEMRSLAFLSSGLIILAGATGSGKSTTAAALLNVVNRHRAVHILTIENPIEYRYPPMLARVSQQQIPDDRSNQALALAMRSDPDVVLMGECIHATHFEGCMRLAETGHLVITTLHARDTMSTCQRISTMCGDAGRESLAQSLRAVISQQLVGDKNDPHKRHLACEFVPIDNAFRVLIGPDGRLRSIGQEVKNKNQDMDHALARLAAEGKISVDKGKQAALSETRFDDIYSRF